MKRNGETPLVSIIVPVYKAEKTILRCVSSLVQQTYTNIEIILVENGSPDKSGEICDAFTDKRIRVIHTLNNGVSKARNDGLEESNGEFIAFCDSDDYYSKNHIEKSLKSALKYNSDIVISGYYVKSKDKITESRMKKSKNLTKNEILNSIITNNYIMGSCWNKLFKKSAIGDKRFPNDLTILEDTYFLLEVLQNTSKIRYINECLYFYCDNANSAVRCMDTLFSDDQLLYIASYNKILSKFQLSIENQNLIRAKLFEMAVWGKNVVSGSSINSPELINNLNHEIQKNQGIFLRSDAFSIKHKIKVLLNLYIPMLNSL